MIKRLFLAAFLPLLTISFVFAQEYGTASYYSDEFHGLETAHGVKYDKNQLSASHKTHPFGTMLKVTRLDNKKSVTVKVIDKGPWIKGRIVDLSKKAALALDLINDGVADVKVEVVGNQEAIVANKPKPATTEAVVQQKTEPKVPVTRPSDYLKTPSTFKGNTATATKAPVKDELTEKGGAGMENVDLKKVYSIKEDGNAKVVRQGYSTSGLYKIVLMKPEKKGFAVQVASYANYENVMRQVASLQGKWLDNIMVNSGKTKAGKKIYKVVLGPFKTASAANNYRKNLTSKHNIKGFVVDLAKI